MKVLAIGDVWGEPSVEFLCRRLPSLRRATGADCIIINGENACNRGITPDLADDLFYAGADVITLGDHAFSNRKIGDYLDEHRYILRPLNMSAALPGQGVCTVDVCGRRLAVVCLIGRVFMDFNLNDPFAAIDNLLPTLDADAVVVEIHAEATSEKQAMGHFLDGRVVAVYGTHTHVQTNDAHILPGGTGYLTDIGFTGGQYSVIGVKPEQSVLYFRGRPAPRFEASTTDQAVQGVLLDIDEKGRCCGIEPITFR